MPDENGGQPPPAAAQGVSGLKPPLKLAIDSQIATNWILWKQQFEIYSIASGLQQKSKIVQSNTLLHCLGQDALVIYNTLDFGDQDKEDPKIVLKLFDAYFLPKKNVTLERHIFLSRYQQPGETFDTFLTDLRSKIRSCNYADLADGILKDQIVIGITDNSVRDRLLRTSQEGEDLTLNKAIDICRAAEQTVTHSGTLSGDSQRNQARNIGVDAIRTRTRQECSRCGTVHAPRACPAYGKTCHKCGGQNHFQKKCRSKKPSSNTDTGASISGQNNSRRQGNEGATVSGRNYRRGRNRQRRRQQTVNELQHDDDNVDSDEDDFHVDSLKKSPHDDAWYVDIKIGSDTRMTKETFKVDTGSGCNTLQQKAYKQLGLRTKKLKKPRNRLVSWSGHVTKPIGKCTLLMEHKNKFFNDEFNIVNDNRTQVLGLKACKMLGLVQLIAEIETKPQNQKIEQKYNDVFKGLGCVTEKVHLKIKPESVPVVHPPRRVPVALRDKVHDELNRMLKLGVIRKTTEPRDWVSSMITVVKKDRKHVRICLDPKDLNKALQREHYPMKTIEQITDKLVGATVFSTLDANCGYWQIPLDDESSKLCCFNSPFGRFEYTRLPFGVNVAPECFQRIMTQTFEDLPGVEVIMDDILVYGSTIKEHDERLEQVLKRCRDQNIKLNREKCHYRTSEVNYMGHRLSDKGLKADPKKIQAVTEMTRPKDKKSLQEWLGMVTYLCKFVPGMSTHTAPLRQLLEDRTEFIWQEVHENSFNKLKTLVTTAPVLKYYDVTKPVTICVDASSTGVGAVIEQDHHPVAYAAKAFTDAQTRYAQIEKELAAVVFGCEKFHEYIFGRHAEILTDHKPLEAIFRKPLHATSLRLQKMLLKLQKYSITVTYTRGKDLQKSPNASVLHVADALSRNYLPETEDDKFDIAVCMINTLPISDEILTEIVTETEKDHSLQKLRAIIEQGWPNTKSEVHPLCTQYWDFRDELTIEEGAIFKNDRIVIPETMRNKMLTKVHGFCHQGVEKTRNLARDIMYWPAMNAQIHDTVSRCEACNTYKANQTRQPMKGHEKPSRSWQKVGTDLFELDGEHYLLIVDYYSSYFEINKLTKLTSKAVIQKCKEQFARFGIPNEVISDNGPNYASAEFTQFSKEYNFVHTKSSPKYPRGNSKSEITVKIAKSLLKKAKRDNQDPYLALLQYRNTPITELGASPVQLLMNCRTRATLPITDKLLQPTIQRKVQAKLEKRQAKQKTYYDRGTKKLSPLKPGDTIRMKSNKTWEKGVVLHQRMHAPESYVVEIGGRKYIRNRQDLRLTNETYYTPPYLDAGISENNNRVNTHHEDNQRDDANYQSQHPQPYRTRSGRVSKPPLRYDEQF